MKVISTIILFSFLINSVKGQENGLRTKLIDENYTWRTTSAETLDSFYFNLQPLETAKLKSQFRISLIGQIVDFYSSDDTTYYGKLTNYSTEYISIKNKERELCESKKYQYVIEQIDLEPAKVNKAVERLIETGQLEIPTDTLIASWQHNFFDCNSIIFQFKINGKYTKQEFTCPWGQEDSTEFINIILANYQTLKSIFQLDSLYGVFESKLPKGKTYSPDGLRMMYMLTDQQSENWKKTEPQRDFMKSVKDSVDLYLNAELKKQNIVLNGIDCFENYRLVFGKNGKLKKISLSHYDKPNLKHALGDYLTDKIEITKCRKKIKQIFRKVDLSFLNLEYAIYRTFSFDYKGEYNLMDETIY